MQKEAVMKNNKKLYKDYLRQILSGKKIFFLFLICLETTTYSISFLLSGLFKQDIFNILSGEPGTLGISDIGVLILLNISVPLIINCVKQINSALITRAEMHIVNAQREILFRNYFNGKISTGVGFGEMINLYRNDCNDVKNYLLQYYYQLPKIVLAVCILIVLFNINFVLTILCLIPVVITVIATKKLGKMLSLYRTNVREAGGQVTEFIENIFDNYEFFSIEMDKGNIKNIFKKKCSKRADYAIRDSMLGKIMEVCSAKSELIVLSIILIFAVSFFRNGSFTVGNFVLFEYYFWFLSSLPDCIANILKERKLSIVAYDRIHKGFQEDKKEAPIKLLVDERHMKIQFDGKIYPLNRQMAAVIIGSRKPLLEKALYCDRKGFFCLYQNPTLFSGTIEENILWGSEKNDELLTHVCKMADLQKDLDIIEDGIKKQVGKGGDAVSGGQRKRIALARILYNRPDILFIENLEDGLDKKTFDRIYNNLLEDKRLIKIFYVTNSNFLER